ncbi:hypothetical protein ACF1AJ_15395 [Leifsonia sp. NPDC014704]|uniref:DUF7927 domain-containing protein n=1 Tax=Leifsonia sp. NPDC014704 TaxID=3364123 RepID=UPI0036F4782B
MIAVSVGVVGLLDVGVTGGSPAEAASTAISDFSKAGTDLTNPSTATPSSPGAATAGDTIQWVLSYRNKTGADASVTVKDAITAGQSYVANSLQVPPNMTGSFSGNTVSATGSISSGTTSGQIPMSTPTSINFTTPGGDGYSVENYGTNVYTVYHHNSSGTVVFCSTISNTKCANWPTNASASYVSPVAGTPIGTGAAGMISAHNNGSFIVGGKLYWEAGTTSPTGGTYGVGVMCLDLTATPRALSCGFTPLDQLTTAPGAAAPIASNGLPAADGNYYLFDRPGNMLCFNPASGACGSVNVTGGRVTSSPISGMITAGNYVYATFVTAGTLYLACYDVSAHASCSGSYPINEGAAPNASYPDTIAPVLDPASGTLSGVCDLAKASCYAPSGAVLSNPYPGITGIGYPSSSTGYGDGLIVGTKFYAAPRNDIVTCWDFSLRVGNGAVPRCAGFSGPTNGSNYTVRALTGDLEGCGAADGDAGQIKIFNLASGGGCNAVQAVSVSLSPSTYYCDGRAGHASAWGAVTLNGLTASDYVSARLTLTDVNGNNVPGWVDVPFPASGPQSIDISSIPVSGTTATLAAHVTIAGSTNPTAMSSARLSMSWSGDGIQICYRTTVAAVPCLTTAPVSNTATAVTTAGATTDGPTGNTSGTVTFTVSNPPSACLLHLTKSASPNPARPGDTVAYTVTVTNTGTAPYAAANPANFTDDISTVLADSSFNAGSLSASTGAASYNPTSRVISWSGPLAAGATATVTYTVTVDDPDTGPHSLVNRVVTPTGVPSNCAAGSSDPACQVTVPVQSFRVAKSTTATQVVPGQVVPYTVTVTNTGQVAYTNGSPASFTDDLSSVLDDAAFNGDATAGAGSVAYSAPVLSWSGPLAVGASVTITYSVTVNTPDTGDKVLLNTVGTPTGSGGNCATRSTDPACRVQIPAKTFSVAKTASAPVADLGGIVTYTLTVTNTGQSAYTAGDPASLTDDLSGVLDDATYRNDASATAGTVSYASPSLSWSGPLAVGATVTITYSVTVHDPDTADHQLDNSVTNPPESGGSCVPGSTDPGCRSIVPVRSYTVAKTSPSTGTVYPGDTVAYVITVTNTGAAAYASGDPATVSDDLGGLLDDAVYNGDATATAGTVSYAVPTLTWSGPLAVGGAVTVTYSVTVDSPDTGDATLTNAALPTGDGGRCADNRAAPCSPVVLPVGSYTVTKTSSPSGIVHPGDTIIYTITVHNPSSGDFTASAPAAFSDDLAAVLDDATYGNDVSASAGSVAYTAPSLTWSGPLAAGATVTVTYSVTVRDPDTGDHLLTNAATPSTPGGLCPGGSPAPCPPTVNPVQSFGVTKVASTAGPLHAGDIVSYTISVVNTGQADYTAAEPASLSDDLSDVLDDADYHGDASATSGTVSYTRPTLSWAGPLAVGSTVTITYSATVKSPDPGDHLLTNAVVTPPRTGGNCSPGSVDPACSVTLATRAYHVQKTTSAASVSEGQTVTYRITITNTGTAPFTATEPAAFVDDLSAVLDDATYADDATATSGTLSYSAPELSWSGELPVGGSAEVTYTVTVNTPENGDRSLRNTVATSVDANCATGSRDPDCRTTSVVDPRTVISAPPRPESPLAGTGSDSLPPTILGALLVAAGLTLFAGARYRRRRRECS